MGLKKTNNVGVQGRSSIKLNEDNFTVINLPDLTNPTQVNDFMDASDYFTFTERQFLENNSIKFLATGTLEYQAPASNLELRFGTSFSNIITIASLTPNCGSGNNIINWKILSDFGQFGGQTDLYTFLDSWGCGAGGSNVSKRRNQKIIIDHVF